MAEIEHFSPSLFDQVFALNSDEFKVVKLPWLTFNHHNQRFQIIIFRMRNTAPHELTPGLGFVSKNVDLEILSSSQNTKGYIGGKLIKNPKSSEILFSSAHLVNADTRLQSGSSPQKLPHHVPGLVKQAVKELILRGGLAEWNSAEVFLTGGQMLYQQLSQDTDLHCQMQLRQKADGTPASVYVLTKPK